MIDPGNSRAIWHGLIAGVVVSLMVFAGFCGVVLYAGTIYGASQP